MRLSLQFLKIIFVIFCFAMFRVIFSRLRIILVTLKYVSVGEIRVLINKIRPSRIERRTDTVEVSFSREILREYAIYLYLYFLCLIYNINYIYVEKVYKIIYIFIFLFKFLRAHKVAFFLKLKVLFLYYFYKNIILRGRCLWDYDIYNNFL